MRTSTALAAGASRPAHAVWLAWGLPLLLTACAQVPEWEGKTALQPAPSATLVAIADVPRVAWPGDHWWTRYGDAQLDALVDKALQEAPDMAAAAARVRQAQALLGVQQSALAPQVAANASIKEDKLSYHHLTPAEMTPRGMNDYGRATLDVSWSLDLWGRQRASIAAAAGELQARQADAAQARLLLASGVATAYAELVRMSATERTLAQSVKVRETTARLFAERFANGLENKGSVHSANARLSAARAQWEQAKEQLGLQRNQIAVLTGASPDAAQQIVVPEAALLQPWSQRWALPENLPANLLGRRPDVVAARLQAQALESRAQAQQEAFYPDVNLAAFVGVQSLGLDMLAKGGSSIASVGPAISLPIFNGGRLRAELGAARARYDEAVASYQATVNRALQEVANNTVSQRALRLQLLAMQDAVAAATEAHRVARNRYEGGLASYLEVLSAEDLLLDGTRQLVEVRARALALDIGLHRALGGGWTEARG